MNIHCCVEIGRSWQQDPEEGRLGSRRRSLNAIAVLLAAGDLSKIVPLLILHPQRSQ